MKVSIQEIPKMEEEEILIKCHEIDDKVLAILKKLKASQKQLIGTLQNEIHRLSIKDVYYFETVDNKSFLYCKEQVYETKLKLYEFEALSVGYGFFRASKSVILNVMKITHIKPSLSGRFDASLENNETVSVSRQYVPELKKHLGL